MSVEPSRIAAGRGAVAFDGTGGAQPRPAAKVMSSSRRQALRYGIGVDDAVVAERQQADRVDLEVEVVRRRLRVAGVADEADHGAGLHLVAVDGERRERREMGVVELVALPVTQPEPVAAEVVPADGEDGPVGDGEERGPERREDVLAVMPDDARARAAPKVSMNDDAP